MKNGGNQGHKRGSFTKGKKNHRREKLKNKEDKRKEDRYTPLGKGLELGRGPGTTEEKNFGMERTPASRGIQRNQKRTSRILNGRKKRLGHGKDPN